MKKEIQRMIDKWYTEYINTYNRFPTWGEVVEKTKEFENRLDK